MNYNKDNTRRRPMEVSEKEFTDNWDLIFGKNKLSEEDEKEVKKQLKDNEELSYKG